MLQFLVKRILILIPTIFIISIVLFIIIKATPGNPVGTNLDVKATAEQRHAEYVRLGLDKPIYIQYIKWLSRTIQGDFGESYMSKKPVRDVIPGYLWNSFILNVVVFIFAFMISIPIGIITAVKKNTKTDAFWNVFSLIGISMPSFFFALIILFAFSVKLRWFPLNGMINTPSSTEGFARFLEIMRHIVLPAVVLTFMSMASLLRYTRTAVLDVLNQDYIRTARAKGLSEKIVIYKHAFRNSLIPIVTLIGLEVPQLFSGAVILESVFIWPGIGNLMVKSIGARDYNLLIALLLLFALMTLLGNLLSDIGYALVDPRIKINEQ